MRYAFLIAAGLYSIKAIACIYAIVHDIGNHFRERRREQRNKQFETTTLAKEQARFRLENPSFKATT